MHIIKLSTIFGPKRFQIRRISSRSRRKFRSTGCPVCQRLQRFLSTVPSEIVFSSHMFAKAKKKATSKQYPGIGNLAAFVLTPSKSPKSSTIHAEETLSGTFATNTTCDSDSVEQQQPVSLAVQKMHRTIRTGDSNSFWTSSNDNVYIDRACAIKGYRVLSYRKLKKNGKRIVFDMLDGKPYYCGVGIQRRITDNAIIFPSKQEALSERFPSNQVCGGLCT